jgi:hypothetical protein
MANPLADLAATAGRFLVGYGILHMGAKQLLITSLFSIELAVYWHKTLDH